MSVLLYMIPLALLLGLFWLASFVWNLRSGQYDDMEGAARRILIDDEILQETEDNNSPRE